MSYQTIYCVECLERKNWVRAEVQVNATLYCGDHGLRAYRRLYPAPVAVETTTYYRQEYGTDAQVRPDWAG